MKRRTTFTVSLIVAARLVALSAGTVLAKDILCKPNRRCEGTRKADVLTGTPDPDRMFGLRGSDLLFGLGAGDTLVVPDDCETLNP